MTDKIEQIKIKLAKARGDHWTLEVLKDLVEEVERLDSALEAQKKGAKKK